MLLQDGRAPACSGVSWQKLLALKAVLCPGRACPFAFAWLLPGRLRATRRLSLRSACHLACGLLGRLKPRAPAVRSLRRKEGLAFPPAAAWPPRQLPLTRALQAQGLGWAKTHGSRLPGACAASHTHLGRRRDAGRSSVRLCQLHTAPASIAALSNKTRRRRAFLASRGWSGEAKAPREQEAPASPGFFLCPWPRAASHGRAPACSGRG